MLFAIRRAHEPLRDAAPGWLIALLVDVVEVAHESYHKGLKDNLVSLELWPPVLALLLADTFKEVRSEAIKLIMTLDDNVVCADLKPSLTSVPAAWRPSGQQNI